MNEEILQELRRLNRQLKELDEKVEKLKKKANKVDRQTATPWQKFKRRIKKASNKPTLVGRVLRKLINCYRYGWRYVYCLIMRRKGMD